MKKLTLTLTLLLAVAIMAIGQTDYKMWQIAYFKPLPNADLKAAKTAMIAHNAQFHKEGPFRATVWSNITGEMAGTWSWAMGPSTFTDYDSRPTDEAHDADWDKLIRGNFELVANEYWEMDDKLSYEPEGFKFGKKVIWTVYDLKRGDGYRFKELVSKIVQVYQDKKYDRDFTVFWNQFDNRDGKDVVIQVSFDNWSFMDEDHKMKADFEEVHGEGSWWKLIEEWRDVVESSYDEVSIRMD